MAEFEYKSYPKGYNNLMKKIFPIYLSPARNMMMKMFLQVLTDD